MTTDVYSRWYRAFQAYNRAQNPAFKAIWACVMNELYKEF